MINFLSRRWRASTHQGGQVLVIVAVGMLVFIAMVGVVIDGGHAWGQQRNTQNGTDAAAEAGAIVLAQNLPYTVAGQPAPNGDAAVLAAVQAAADANGIDLEAAFYTDIDGNRLPGPMEVGSLGGAPPPSAALGVEAIGTRDFETFLAGVMGFDEMTARTDATAAAGIIAEAGASTVLPVTFPVTITGCDGSNRGVQHPGGDRWELGEYYVVPLCSGGPGNVGWLDWDPDEPGEPDACDGEGNGNNELRCAVRTPSNPAIIVPEWYHVMGTGNPGTADLEDALNEYSVPPGPEANAPAGTTVLIPLFDADCDEDPPTAARDACTSGGGHGSNMWYHLADWTAFEIDWVDLGGGRDRCGTSDVVPGTDANGGTGCFGGWFRGYFGPGEIRAPTEADDQTSTVGIQLIK